MGRASEQGGWVVEPIRVRAKLQWKAFLDPASGKWVALCEPLKLTADGETWQDLWDSANDAVQFLLVDLVRKGRLQQFMREHGWKLAEGARIPTRQEALTRRPRFDVPFELSSSRPPAYALS